MTRELPYPCSTPTTALQPKEALTQFLPDHRKGVIDYIDVRGRTKIMVRNVVSDYIPNPTFEVVARPGAQEEYFRHGSGGKSFREVMGKPMKAIPAFRNPEARIEVMDSLALDYTLMFPTLASLVEEPTQGRSRPDPRHRPCAQPVDVRDLAVHYEDRIFSTPVINLGNVDRALEELEWCLERGAKTVLVRPAPVPGYRGTRSLGVEEFDPFWDACVKAGIPVSMHASDSGYSEYLNDGSPAIVEPFAPTSFRMVAMGKPPIEDTMATLVCHGALTRNPDLRVLSIENGADSVPYLFKQFKNVYSKCPRDFSRIRSRRSVDASTSRRSRRTTSPRWPAVRRRPRDLRFRRAPPGGPGAADEPDRRSCRSRRRGAAKVMGRNMIDLFKIPNDVVHSRVCLLSNSPDHNSIYRERALLRISARTRSRFIECRLAP